MSKIGGLRKKSRSKFSKPRRQRGKVGVSRYFNEFKPGEKVMLQAEPSVHKGLYFSRFHGKSGTMGARRGECYEIFVRDQGKEKTIIAHPAHIRRL